MRLHLLNYVVGLNSFWNLAAPATALGIFLVGLLGWAASRRATPSRVGLVITAIGVVAFLVACGFDGARNIHDANQLGAAAHARYGVTLTYADDAALFGSGKSRATTVAGQAATEYGAEDMVLAGRTTTIALSRLGDGTYLLTADGKEIASAR